jgi:hypothetical protein
MISSETQRREAVKENVSYRPHFGSWALNFLFRLSLFCFVLFCFVLFCFCFWVCQRTNENERMKKVFLISRYQPTSGADSTSTPSSKSNSKQQQRGKETGGLAVSKLTNFLSSLPNLSLTTTSTPSLLRGEGEEPAVVIVASKDEELIFSLLKQYRNKTQMNWRVFFVIFDRTLR